MTLLLPVNERLEMPWDLEIYIRVYGLPAPQGSKVPMRSTRGRLYVKESSKNVLPWRQAVQLGCREAIKRYKHLVSFPLTEQVKVEQLFLWPRPASHFGTGSRSTVLKESSPYFQCAKNKGDLDKVLRASWDGLSRSTGGALLFDDTQVVCSEESKEFAHADQPPGAIMVVSRAKPKLPRLEYEIQ